MFHSHELKISIAKFNYTSSVGGFEHVLQLTVVVKLLFFCWLSLLGF